MDFGKIVLGPENKGVDQKALAATSMSGFADFGFLDIAGWSGSDGDDISLAEVFGTGKLFRALKSCDTSEGVVYVRTENNFSNGYVPYPMNAGEKDILLTPITHIRASGSISGVIVFWQEVA
jgi:hypothetical protein